ncbi:MAG: DUF3747 domain-containing protein [Leptolyngbyaceae bacterium]|nr:DUF3747 domain-containing protein [Leptolyngbyaceae bacterium]
MSISLSHRLGIIATASATAIGAVAAFTPAFAALFGEKEVDQNKFIAIAAPFGEASHKLLILEQISNTQACWDEFGSAPTQVDPLLVNFDFTGICGRSTDSNGYSIRVDGEDLALRYSLRVVREDGDLVLMGFSSDIGDPELEIARANGITDGFAKLNLSPGWQFSKRTYNDTTLGHVYLSYDSSIPGIGQPTQPNNGNTDNPTVPGGEFSFPDIGTDVYAQEIQSAVELGFIAGFYEDNTFRPRQSLTREQLVSMVLESLDRLPNANLDIPTQVSSNPYPDVQANRWSAAKIQFARQNNIVSGYEDGTFRPNQPVTRAELMAVLKRAAEYGQTISGEDATLWPSQDAFDFADIDSHWAARTITQMSSYCSAASPLNETGTSFYPNNPALRNYAAAATLRMLNCVSGDTATPSDDSLS